MSYSCDQNYKNNNLRDGCEDEYGNVSPRFLSNREMAEHRDEEPKPNEDMFF